MPRERDADLELPYGRVAAWGMALSAAVTLTAVLFAPLSPLSVLRRAVDGSPSAPFPAATVLSHGPAGSSAASGPDGRIEAEPRSVLREEILREVRREVALGMRHEFRALVERDLRASLLARVSPMAVVLPGSAVPAPPFTIGL